ncbi:MULTISPECIES: hypothetical protein [unclassified Pseudoalteromonas]|uniref:DUF6979 family protein n=1 Tax=unclassified Pseudoalteromonas TaxID=194690 RepID=UPI000694A9FF|nr:MULTISPECIES: hypothetical protein [unclassified Pseudoalteromonas]
MKWIFLVFFFSNYAFAVEQQTETTPQYAWASEALTVFPTQSSSRVKGCPKSAFLGLCELGTVKGVAKGKYTSSVDNKKYAEDPLSFFETRFKFRK